MTQRSLSGSGLVARTFGIRGTVLRTLVILILLTTAAISWVSLRGAYRAVDELSTAMIETTGAEAAAELDGFFDPVARGLAVVRQWGRRGALPLDDPEALNRTLVPLLRGFPQVSSVLIARPGGVEYLLLRRGEEWLNRLTRADEWGGRTRWLRWSDELEPLEAWWQELDYDPRARPWHRGAMATAREGDVHWTEPYTFFTTRDPGITASLRWSDPAGAGGSVVAAFDVLLADLSRFTRELRVTDRGIASVLTADGRVLGLPADPRWEDPAALRQAVLSPVAALDHPVLAASVARFEERRASGAAGPFPLALADAAWWAGFRPYYLGAERLLWIAVLVPESDLAAGAVEQRNLLLLLSLLALAGALGAGTAIERILRRRFSSAIREARRVGQYTLERRIGVGGMGEVWRARHSMLRRPTAVKVLRPDQAREREMLARFEREVQLCAGLTHPNTIAIYDFGRTPDGAFYYAMEYLRGVTLREAVEAGGPMPAGRVIHILRQACGSLAEAHRAGLIHRDVKPANLMLTERGGVWDFVKVLDFGLVKDLSPAGSDPHVTRDGELTGTPLFVAPEAIEDPARQSAAGDIYALGGVAYFALTGRHVFEGSSSVQVLARHLRDDPVPPSQHADAVPADLEAVILRCLAKDPEARPGSAEALEAELAVCVAAGDWGAGEAEAWWLAHGAELLGDEAEPAADSGPRSLRVDLELRETGET